MPTVFSLTLDSIHKSLVLVAGERIVDDVTEIRIAKAASGSGYDCEVTRAGNGKPVRLVATASAAGKAAIERANARESSGMPGFVEAPVSPPVVPPVVRASVQKDIARCFGVRY